MPSYINGIKIKKYYLGSKPVIKGIINRDKVWPNTPPNAHPVAAFIYSPSDLVVQFTSTSHDPDGTIVKYAWNFGDGRTSALENPSHIYASEGTRDVRLTVTDNGGLTSSVTRRITVIVADKPLTGDAAILLKTIIHHSHTNSGHTVRMEDLSANKVFPEGQKVYVGGYQCDYNLLQKARDSGITVVGYHGVVRDHASQLANAKKYGLMYAPLIREINGYGGGYAHLFSCYVNGTRQSGECGGYNVSCSGVKTIGQARVNQYATDAMKQWMALDDDNIYGWLYCLDDCRLAAQTSHTASLYKAMRDADPKKRTIGDFGYGSSYANSISGRQHLEQITCTISQLYYHGGDYTGDGDGFHKSRAIIGKNAQVLKSNCEQVHSNNGKPRLIVQGWMYGFAWNVVPSENSNAAYFKRQYLHDSLLSLMKGCNGIHWYQMRMGYGSDDRAIGSCPAEHKLRFDAVFAAMKIINKDSDTAKALVWGKRTGHTKAITVTGSNTYTYGKNKGTTLYPGYTENMINHQDIQFKGRRFVIITNSTPTRAVVAWWKAHPAGVKVGDHNAGPAKAGCTQSRTTWSHATRSFAGGVIAAPPKYDVPVTISGFPNDASKGEIVITELVSGAVVHPDSNGRISTTMKPLESRIYEIKTADGYIN